MTKYLERIASVTGRTGLSRASIYRLIREGAFPKPVPLVGRTVAWDSEAVDCWIAERLSAAETPKPQREAA